MHLPERSVRSLTRLGQTIDRNCPPATTGAAVNHAEYDG
jgi:hypothetical protein